VRKKQIAKLVGRDIQETYKEDTMMDKFEPVFRLLRSIFVTCLWIWVAISAYFGTYLAGIMAAILIAVCELEEINEKMSEN